MGDNKYVCRETVITGSTLSGFRRAMGRSIDNFPVHPTLGELKSTEGSEASVELIKWEALFCQRHSKFIHATWRRATYSLGESRVMIFLDIGVGTEGAVGAAAPPILGQGVLTMHYASSIF